jgi:hypothetical protein
LQMQLALDEGLLIVVGSRSCLTSRFIRIEGKPACFHQASLYQWLLIDFV